MPVSSQDGKFILCSYCNQRFRFGYDANLHEKEKHSDELKSATP
ncbi:hypothetical protein Desor_0129 [Desulfosporosinus orientis DSM 765]|uniref:C2H2-type domain-containing protein n=1 Tax=Desulfosporosinus orientis (strain ATCC 19365 / DSM 765 / NCIMB 8382 / VKM B-1628 / Singapore I) TaxID=768706 RepID=G7W4Z1_DESOD|nr:hypothetical protein Desor_0129 [Desulfosporosinus orientis DSM 765]